MQHIRTIRQKIDHLMIQTKKYDVNRETSLAYTNTQRGSMWLGLVLKALQEPNPYPESTNTASTKIEPRADQAKDSPAMFEGAPSENKTITVKWFREQLEQLIVVLTTEHNTYTNAEANHAVQVATDALKEAKMWWGWELNNIFNREQASSPKQ